jgi:SAM-dependent methyltransferase
VSVVQGDASTLAPRWSGRCAAVVSVFGLQQLSDPHAAIRSWANALRPSGRLSVVFWPDISERDGPFARIQEVVRAHVPPGDASWENGLATALAAQGAVVERDETLAYPITHPHARAFFDAYSRFGPLRAHGLARGEAFIDTLRRQFLRDAPPGEWSHRPHGRIVVACRIGRELRGRDGKW